jgi:hypothetical protein
MGFLLLGIDSLIACFAVGALVSRRSWLSYATLFGLCDAGGYLLGTALHWSMPDGVAKVVETAALVGLGLYLLVVAIGVRRVSQTRWVSALPLVVWALPFLLSIDNVTYGVIDARWTNSVLGQAGEQALSSAFLAFIGLSVGATVVRTIPQMERSGVLKAGFAGVALIVAAPLLVPVG